MDTISSMWGFMEHAKVGNLTLEGWKMFEHYLRRVCKIVDIDYDMAVRFQVEAIEKKRKENDRRQKNIS